jgi:multiple sugar transport system ATP-binding protein
LSNLDAQLRDNTRAELKELHQNIGITTIYVTHDQVEAMTLADKIVVLKGGKIQQIGTPQTIYTQPANRMVATFLGNPPMNILPGTCTGGGLDVVGNLLPLTMDIQQQFRLEPGQTIDLGIRPEHLTISPGDDSPGLVGEVKVVEPLGRETLIRLGLPNSDVIVNAIAPADRSVRPGDRLKLELDFNQLFVFNPATGDRILPVS